MGFFDDASDAVSDAADSVSDAVDSVTGGGGGSDDTSSVSDPSGGGTSNNSSYNSSGGGSSDSYGGPGGIGRSPPSTGGGGGGGGGGDSDPDPVTRRVDLSEEQRRAFSGQDSDLVERNVSVGGGTTGGVEDVAPAPGVQTPDTSVDVVGSVQNVASDVSTRIGNAADFVTSGPNEPSVGDDDFRDQTIATGDRTTVDVGGGQTGSDNTTVDPDRPSTGINQTLVDDATDSGGIVAENTTDTSAVLPGEVAGVDISEQRLEGLADAGENVNERISPNESVDVPAGPGNQLVADVGSTTADATGNLVGSTAALPGALESTTEFGQNAPLNLESVQTAGSVGVSGARATGQRAIDEPGLFAAEIAVGGVGGTAAVRGVQTGVRGAARAGRAAQTRVDGVEVGDVFRGADRGMAGPPRGTSAVDDGDGLLLERTEQQSQTDELEAAIEEAASSEQSGITRGVAEEAVRRTEIDDDPLVTTIERATSDDAPDLRSDELQQSIQRAREVRGEAVDDAALRPLEQAAVDDSISFTESELFDAVQSQRTRTTQRTQQAAAGEADPPGQRALEATAFRDRGGRLSQSALAGGAFGAVGGAASEDTAFDEQTGQDLLTTTEQANQQTGQQSLTTTASQEATGSDVAQSLGLGALTASQEATPSQSLGFGAVTAQTADTGAATDSTQDVGTQITTTTGQDLGAPQTTTTNTRSTTRPVTQATSPTPQPRELEFNLNLDGRDSEDFFDIEGDDALFDSGILGGDEALDRL